jgi:hypothetical protein
MSRSPRTLVIKLQRKRRQQTRNLAALRDPEFNLVSDFQREEGTWTAGDFHRSYIRI